MKILLDYVTGQNGAYSEDDVLGKCATWDEFLQREANALDELLSGIMSSPDAPQWVIFATHQMPQVRGSLVEILRQ